MTKEESDLEDYLKGKVLEIYERAKADAQPYIDQLVMLESLRPKVWIALDRDGNPLQRG